MNYLTQSGQCVSLARQPLGRGGEGQVLPVAGSPTMVAKIFHKPTRERWLKLAAMIAHPMPKANGNPLVAWPNEVLFTHETQPKFAGYLMPRITEAHPLFTYYVMSTRQKKYPGFNYRYLARCAHNLAAAVALAHQHGHVIGDLNESNALADLQGIVRLLDVDSWQVVDSIGGVTYPCGVGKGEFIAPELQGQDLSRFRREPCHDNFALAVLIFKLINEGNHPADGVYRGRGEPPSIESRIAAGTFPYCDGSGCWLPKPFAVPFGSLHPRLQQLFIQTFQTGHSRPQMRPDARAWQKALAQAEKDFRVCANNPQHFCWTGACTWCERTALLGGLDPFPGPSLVKPQAKPRPATVQQPATNNECQPQPAPSWQPVWLPVPIAEIIQSIAQRSGLSPAVITAVAAGLSTLAGAAAFATLRRFLM